MTGIVCIHEGPLPRSDRTSTSTTVIDEHQIQLVTRYDHSYFIDRGGDPTYLAVPRNPAEPPFCWTIPNTAGQQPTVEANRQPDKAVQLNAQLLRFSTGTP